MYVPSAGTSRPTNQSIDDRRPYVSRSRDVAPSRLNSVLASASKLMSIAQDSDSAPVQYRIAQSQEYASAGRLTAHPTLPRPLPCLSVTSLELTKSSPSRRVRKHFLPLSFLLLFMLTHRSISAFISPSIPGHCSYHEHAKARLCWLQMHITRDRARDRYTIRQGGCLYCASGAQRGVSHRDSGLDRLLSAGLTGTVQY